MSYVKNGNVYYLHTKATPWADVLHHHMMGEVVSDFSFPKGARSEDTVLINCLDDNRTEDLFQAPIELMSDHELDDLFYMLAGLNISATPVYFPIFHRFDDEIKRMRFIRDKWLFGTKYELMYDDGFESPYCLLEWRIVL